jgi:hypothetical protein
LSFLNGSGREDLLVNQSLPQTNAMRQIDFENSDRGAANFRTTNEVRPVPLEMLLPLIAPWMEESHNSLGERIATRDVRPFVVVAREAR